MLREVFTSKALICWEQLWNDYVGTHLVDLHPEPKATQPLIRAPQMSFDWKHETDSVNSSIFSSNTKQIRLVSPPFSLHIGGTQTTPPIFRADYHRFLKAEKRQKLAFCDTSGASLKLPKVRSPSPSEAFSSQNVHSIWKLKSHE